MIDYRGAGSISLHIYISREVKDKVRETAMPVKIEMVHFALVRETCL